MTFRMVSVILGLIISLISLIMYYNYNVRETIYVFFTSNYIISQYILFGCMGLFSTLIYKLFPLFEIVILFGLQSFGYYYYEIDEPDMVDAIDSRINISSTMSKNGDRKLGYLYSLKDKYFIYISQKILDGRSGLIYSMITTKKKFDELTLVKKVSKESNKKINIFYNCSSSIMWSHWKKRDLEIKNMKYYNWQKKMIKKIKEIYNNNNRCVVVIHGKSGVGKSTLALMVANNFMSSYINEYKPQYHKFSSFYSGKNNISKIKPLIVSLDEFDVIIDNFNTKKIKGHMPDIFDKQSWNMFFDNIHRGMYPHVIFIMTTNKPISYFNKLDPSFLASHRIDYQLNL